MNRDSVNDRIDVAASIARDKNLYIVRSLQSVAQSLQVSFYTADMWRIVLADLHNLKSISHSIGSESIRD